MEQWIVQIAENTPYIVYIVIIGVILLSGFGLPLPEDIPLIAVGYLAGRGYVDPWVMFPACCVAILGADATLYFLGRRYGHHVPRWPLIRRYLTEERLAKTEAQLEKHGGKFIFVARFLPGLRTPAMFSAGVFKVPAWKFFAYDGTAAAVSVPLILGLAYYFADEIDQVKEWVRNGQLTASLVLGGVVVAFIVFKVMFKRRMQRTRD